MTHTDEEKVTAPSKEQEKCYNGIEKNPKAVPDLSPESLPVSSGPITTSTPTWQKIKQWNSRFESVTGLESRGIARVPESEREEITSSSYLQILLLWISCDLTANGITLGMLGPLVFRLSLKDASLCAVFGVLIGCLGPAYVCTWGPRSGNRTMIVARYFMGYYPSKICCLLSMVIMLGYGTINCIITGQILSAVQGHGMSLVVGILIAASITLVVAVIGMKGFHTYERYAWLPQVLILFILVGGAGTQFNTTTPSAGDMSTRVGHRISFLSLCLSSPIAWSACAADFFVYYPPNLSKRSLFLATYIGNILPFSFAYLLGVGLASGVSSNPDWANAYSNSQGALILAGFSGLKGFGSFCGVILALGIIADNIAATYSAALVLQMLDRRVGKVPRWVLTCVIAVVFTACALGGRNFLFEIFQNFLALVGYWTMFFVCIALEEQVLFRASRHKRARSRTGEFQEDCEDDDGYVWDAWSDPKAVPIGLAALAAFLIGWAGAVVSMDQVWYVGPIARMVGEDGADLGLWVGAGWTLLTFPPLRLLELRWIGR